MDGLIDRLLESESIAAISSRQPRAKRISEAKWNQWRIELENLYLVKEASQEDIIDFLRTKHRKEITAKQLKHQFKKWGIRKYISGQDMTSIISLVNEHEAQGNEITILYKGHEVERSRIERAMRRYRGPFPSTRPIPSYIEYKCTLPRISQFIQRENPTSSGQNSVERSTVFSSTAFLPVDEGAQSLNSLRAKPNVSQVSGSVGSLGDHGLDRSPGVFTNSFLTSADAGVLSTTSPVDDHIQGMNSVNAVSHQNCDVQEDFVGTRTCENAGSCMAGTLSLGDPSSSGTIGGLCRSAENTRPASGWLGQTIQSPLSFSTDSCNNLDGGMDSNILLAKTRNDVQVILPNGDDPERIVTSLQLTRSHLLTILDGSMRDPKFFRGSTPVFIRHLLWSGWLLDQLENLLSWSYDASARAVQLRRSAKNGALKGHILKSSDIPNDKNEVQGTDTNLRRRRSGRIGTLSGPQAKLTGVWSCHMPNCTLNIQLRTVIPPHLAIDDKESSSVLEMSSIPITEHRTTGVTAIFINPFVKNQGPRISPEIQTFNVVPEGSDIIRYVQNNDLRGVQSLFDLGKASPSDVDSRGFSLLSASALFYSSMSPLTFSFVGQYLPFITCASRTPETNKRPFQYAMHNGCSAIFNLLVRTGAGVQNCKRFGSQHDAVGSIWSYFVIYNSNDGRKEHVPKLLGNFDECKRMTEVVLAHGCDIEDTIGFSGQANALFELCYHWPMDQAHASTPGRTLEYLISIGYELEKKNPYGQTPLLWTASSYQPQVIKCLRIFFTEDANLNAVDTAGRGVVHSALAAPHILDSWRTLTITIHGVHVTELYGYPHQIYHTESTAHAVDYSDQALESSPLGEQDNPSLLDSEACLLQNDHYGTIKEIHGSADDISTIFDSAPTAPTPVEDRTLEEYVLILDSNGVEHLVKNPIHVLKIRLRYKLLTLLQVGCDPNILDNAGASPSDYARRDGLWPQWSWALEKSGHVYDARNDRWVRAGRFENL